ncbi:C2 family cysteine protease [Nocardioides sp. SYSU D00065]|uniref:C2 family cysteine protease n=1 Tax=Nocardioides sp. SYSU D00065 TaxID=2817378 RepID=UPI001B33FB71|nr:C2 family cysteine protease [Nocardioides sp. SYSU D00065]
MITVSRLVAFEPGPWQSAAEWSRERGKAARRTETDLDQEAAKVAQAWPSPVGQLAAAILRQQADAQGELAVAYDDAGVVIDDATIAMGDLRQQMVSLQATVAGTPDMSGPDDSGVVTGTRAFDNLVEFLQNRAAAGQFTITAREILMQATDRDRAASIALLGIVGIDVPPTNDGPIDLSDDGIQLQADLNAQDRYGDCTTLSTLIGIAHSDPDFIRRHMVWDPETGTYQVTLYRDGEPVTVSVDPATLPTDGSQQAATNKPSWLSVYEQAIQQEFGDVANGQFEEVPIARITGEDVPRTGPPSAADIERAMDQDPRGVITADTANAPAQPDNVDPAKRVVPGHTYCVRGLDADGNVILQNPWGPGGGWHDGKYYPGEVHLTPEEYERWFSNGAVLNPPY